MRLHRLPLLLASSALLLSRATTTGAFRISANSRMPPISAPPTLRKSMMAASPTWQKTATTGGVGGLVSRLGGRVGKLIMPTKKLLDRFASKEGGDEAPKQEQELASNKRILALVTTCCLACTIHPTAASATATAAAAAVSSAAAIMPFFVDPVTLTYEEVPGAAAAFGMILPDVVFGGGGGGGGVVDNIGPGLADAVCRKSILYLMLAILGGTTLAATLTCAASTLLVAWSLARSSCMLARSGYDGFVIWLAGRSFRRRRGMKNQKSADEYASRSKVSHNVAAVDDRVHQLEEEVHRLRSLLRIASSNRQAGQGTTTTPTKTSSNGKDSDNTIDEELQRIDELAREYEAAVEESLLLMMKDRRHLLSDGALDNDRREIQDNELGSGIK